MVQLMPLLSSNPLSLVSFESRLVSPFWYRLTQVVLEKRPLNRCISGVVVRTAETAEPVKMPFWCVDSWDQMNHY